MSEREVIALERIADALDRAYPRVPKPAYPRASELFEDPNSDPVGFVMDLWGHTRAEAEEIIATTKAQEEESPVYKEWSGQH